MEVTRIRIEGIVKGLGVNGVRETFIDTTDPIDLTKPFFAVTGMKNVSEYAWKHYCDGNYGLVECWDRTAIENPRKYVISTAHIAFVEYWEREQA